MADSAGYHGSLVAFEGPADLVSAQLRLLPNSPKILIIPSLQQPARKKSASTPFDVRSYIRSVHEACSARTEMAISFLRQSSPDNKRLVFMNGGTASAQLLCINAIREHTVNRDSEKAQAMFYELVRNGVAGLERGPRSTRAPRRTRAVEDTAEGKGRDSLMDAISQAMRAADALDRETAALQPNSETEFTVEEHRRSVSVPMRRTADDFEGAAPFYVFGTCLNNEPATLAQETPTQGQRLPTPPREAEPTFPSCAGEVYSRKPSLPVAGVGSTTTCVPDGLESPPSSPVFELGKACVVDVRPSTSRGPIRSNTSTSPVRSHKRIKSVDRIYASAIRNQDISLSSGRRLDEPDEPIIQDESRLQALIDTIPEYAERQTLRSKIPSQISRATFAKARPTTIRRGPPSHLDLSRTAPILPKQPTIYVDKGTSPDTEYAEEATCIGSCYTGRGADAEVHEPFDLELGACIPFVTVLPMLEDLVVNFKHNASDLILESILRDFKDGVYPVAMPPLLQDTADSFGACPAPKPQGPIIPNIRSPKSTPSVPNHTGHGEYDPFSPHKTCLQPPSTWSGMGATEKATTLIRHAPPTPVQTPPPTVVGTETKFHDLQTSKCRTAVCIQNSLRSVLNVYFPPEDPGYHQLSFPPLPELSSLWRPVFRETGSHSPAKEHRNIDLIIAIGAHKGVKREFLSRITGSLEDLGKKPNGITRSSRLDLRYLIANAMQTFTSQPLAKQTQDHPFTNNLLLATLIIPHLETYMVAHTETRLLLLEYSPEHLSTVLALQRLIGVDLLKIASILNGESPDSRRASRYSRRDSRSTAHSSSPSVSSVASSASSRTTATLLSPSGVRSSESTPFSKANFVLHSAASESEISTFISTFWKILIDISPSYLPDGSPRQSASRRNLRQAYESTIPTSPLVNSIPNSPLVNSTASPLASSTSSPLVNSSPASPLVDSKRPNVPFIRSEVISGLHMHPPSPPQSLASSAPASPSPQTPASTARFLSSPIPFPLPPPPPIPEMTPAKLHPNRVSISDSIKSCKTMKSRKSKLQRMLGEEAIMESDNNKNLLFSDRSSGCFDGADDEMSQFAADERKYMPLFMRMPDDKRKATSRKALAWLGLS